MRKLVLALTMALFAWGALGLAAAGDAFDFGDMPPLPPPLLDDSPNPPPLSPPESGSRSPLMQTPLPPPGGQAASTTSPSPLAPPPVSPLAPSSGGSSLMPPAPPPLAPPPASTDSASATGTQAAGAPPPIAVGTTPSAAETPRTGKISGGRVNVRAGPNTQYESIAVLTTGSPVTVLARNGEWFKIIYPADQLASIHKNYVDADIAGEIPEAGLPGVVNQDGSDVHAYYWDKSTVVGKLNKGDPVTIKQERGQWYRIAAPETARAFVFAQYVKVDGADAVVADASPAPENPAVDLSRDGQGPASPAAPVRLSPEDVKANEIKMKRYRELQEKVAMEEEIERTSTNQLVQAIDSLESRLRALDEEAGSRLSYSVHTTYIGSAAWAPPDPAYGGYFGWVENIGRLGGAPASFRLVKGGEIRYHLRSERYNLGEYVGRRVWVNGAVEHAAGAVANILNVTDLRILTDLEIAETMRQQQETTVGGTQAVGAQPYVAPQSTDPYAVYYESSTTTPVYDVYTPPTLVPQGSAYQPATAVPADPSQLPDIVGGGGSFGTGSLGEVDSDFYQAPAISEIGP